MPLTQIRDSKPKLNPAKRSILRSFFLFLLILPQLFLSRPLTAQFPYQCSRAFGPTSQDSGKTKPKRNKNSKGHKKSKRTPAIRRSPLLEVAQQYKTARDTDDIPGSSVFTQHPLGIEFPEISGSLIVSSRSKDSIEPGIIYEKMERQLRKAISAFRQIDKPIQRQSVLVIVETHPQAILLGDPNDTKQPLYARQQVLPGIGKAESPFFYVNQGGRWDWVGNLLMVQEQQPALLLLTALSPKSHTLDEKFMLYHELAHLTERAGSKKSRLWREARSDFLAWALTGESELSYPPELTRLEDSSTHHLRSDPLDHVKVPSPRPVIRSLVKPTVAHVDDLVPELAAYHANSQILSATLVRIAESFSPKLIYDLIAWIDRLPDEAIPDISSIPPELSPRELPNNNLPILAAEEAPITKKKKYIARRLREELNEVGELIESWAEHNQDLQRKDRKTIRKALEDPGLL
jgi:hypothetical protein